MSQVHDADDEESNSFSEDAIPGYNCHQCKVVVPGGMNAYMAHLQANDHVAPFRCGYCKLSYSNRRTLYDHLRIRHEPTIPGPSSSSSTHLPTQVASSSRTLPDSVSSQNVPLENVLQEPVFDFGHSVHQVAKVPEEEVIELGPSLQSEAELSVLKLRSITYMTNVAIQAVNKQCYSLMQDTATHLKIKVLDFLSKPDEERNLDQLLEEFTIEDPFQHLKTKQQQLSCFQKKYGLLPPQEIFLGDTFDSRQHPKRPRLEPTLIHQSYQYVSIIDILKSVLSDPHLRNLILSEKSSDDEFLRSFRDGALYNTLPPELKTAIRIVLYVDDLEVLQALSSKAGAYKVAGMYFGIQNLPAELNSLLNYIFVTGLAYAEDAKRKEVWDQFLRDMRKLETEGIDIEINGETCNFKAVLVAQIGDTLAAHELLGFLNPSCNAFCRFCYILRPEMWADGMKMGLPRTPEKHATDILGCNNVVLRRATGVRAPPLLDGLTFFHCVKTSVPDIFHDLNQGVCKMEIKLALREYVCRQKYLTDDELNSRVKFFDYGFADKKNKPSPNFTSKYLNDMDSYNLHQTGAQMWCLVRVFPFLFADLVPEDDKFFHLICLLNQIMTIVFANALSEYDLQELDRLIYEHHTLFQELFPGIPPATSLASQEEEIQDQIECENSFVSPAVLEVVNLDSEPPTVQEVENQDIEEEFSEEEFQDEESVPLDDEINLLNNPQVEINAEEEESTESIDGNENETDDSDAKSVDENENENDDSDAKSVDGNENENDDSDAKFSPIKNFFATHVWVEMSAYDKSSYLALYENYLHMLKGGYPAIPPNFMNKPLIGSSTDNVSKKSKGEQEWSCNVNMKALSSKQSFVCDICTSSFKSERLCDNHKKKCKPLAGASGNNLIQEQSESTSSPSTSRNYGIKARILKSCWREETMRSEDLPNSTFSIDTDLTPRSMSLSNLNAFGRSKENQCHEPEHPTSGTSQSSLRTFRHTNEPTIDIFGSSDEMIQNPDNLTFRKLRGPYRFTPDIVSQSSSNGYQSPDPDSDLTARSISQSSTNIFGQTNENQHPAGAGLAASTSQSSTNTFGKSNENQHPAGAGLAASTSQSSTNTFGKSNENQHPAGAGLAASIMSQSSSNTPVRSNDENQHFAGLAASSTSQSSSGTLVRSNQNRRPLSSIQMEIREARFRVEGDRFEDILPDKKAPNFVQALNTESRINRLMTDATAGVKYKYDVKSILQQTGPKERGVLDILNRGEFIHGTTRNIVVNALVGYLFQTVSKISLMSTVMRECMAVQVVATWPSLQMKLYSEEDRPWHHWYNADQNTGYLENATQVTQRTSKRPGSKGIRQCRKDSKKPRTLAVAAASQGSDSEDPEDYIKDVSEASKLVGQAVHKTLVLTLMTRTFDRRRQKIQFLQVDTVKILSEFPHFMHYHGEVIEQEFNLMHEQKQSCFALKFVNITVPKLLMVAAKDPDKYKFCTPSRYDVINAMLILAKFLPTPQRRHTHEADMLLQADLKDLFNVIQVGSDPVAYMSKRQAESDYKIQPHILATGNSQGVRKMWLVVDGRFLELRTTATPATAIDLLIKSFFVFHLHFPLSWKNVFRYLQVNVFEIPLENKKLSKFSEKYKILENMRL